MKGITDLRFGFDGLPSGLSLRVEDSRVAISDLRF
jgi:hypothetical protein